MPQRLQVEDDLAGRVLDGEKTPCWAAEKLIPRSHYLTL
jgi:hypothetical protein